MTMLKYLNIVYWNVESWIFKYLFQQILSVEILQHRFNIEKMVKVSELLQAYSESEDMGSLQVPIMNLLTLKICASAIYTAKF